MSLIGLNYDYVYINDNKILFNYIMFYYKYKLGIIKEELDNEYYKKIIKTNPEELNKFIKFIGDKKKFIKILKDNKHFFKNNYIVDLLINSYDIEIKQKFLNENININKSKSNKNIKLFSKFIGFNTKKYFQKLIYNNKITSQEEEKYINNYQDKYSINWYINNNYTENYLYKIINFNIEKYISFLEKILHKEEVNFIKNELLNEWYIIIDTERSGAVTNSEIKTIKLGTKSNITHTIYHELTHAVNYISYNNNFSSNNINENKILTLHKEGIAVFIGSFLGYDIDNIKNNSNFVINKKFNNIYISKYVYMMYKIFNNQMEDGLNKITDLESQKVTLINRLYKFFPYNQKNFFYPKELTYHIGTNMIVDNINNTNNKKGLLREYLLMTSYI